ncbi:MAG: DNA damage-inducible protein D [Planctomycetaceae bacterium]|nr:DNA damage-inducible protein D [Planctomycetaceae bacterium]
MDKKIIHQLHADFERCAQTFETSDVEFWFARDLQKLLGYKQWRNFEPVIEKAVLSCLNAGENPDDHFARARKMIETGKTAQREVDEIALTRYACYLIAQNGDPRKTEIAFAQSYFAVQTRKMELVEKRLEDMERLQARKKLSETEKQLSGIIFERLRDNQCFGRIRSKGDTVLFGGISTQDMKKRLGAPDSRPLADFLPTITIKAKDFASEITNFNIKAENLRSEEAITTEHVRSNRRVRKTLIDSGIVPEKLPPAEDVKKLQRRLESEHKKKTAKKKTIKKDV